MKITIHASDSSHDALTPIQFFIGLGEDHYTVARMTADDAIRYGKQLMEQGANVKYKALAEELAFKQATHAMQIVVEIGRDIAARAVPDEQREAA